VKAVRVFTCSSNQASHLSGRNGHQKLPKISIQCRFNQKHCESGAKAALLQTLHFKNLKVHPRIGHEGPKGRRERGIALLLL